MYTLFARSGWGSALVEAQLVWYELPFVVEEVGDLFRSVEARAALARVNPAAQLPTLVMPDGRVMTESAAITLILAEEGGGDSLVPAPGDPARATFLRWLVFLVANLYPTFTYADDPSRFVDDPAARKPFRHSVDRHAQRLWRMVEDAAARPWFLGERFCGLDIFIAVMTHWRPRRAWFAAHCPKLHAIAVASDAQPKLGGVLRRNFPES